MTKILIDKKTVELAIEALERIRQDTFHPAKVFAYTPTLITLYQALEQSTEQERHVLQAKGEHPAPCARFCEANAFKIEIRNLKKRLEQPAEQKPIPQHVLMAQHYKEQAEGLQRDYNLLKSEYDGLKIQLEKSTEQEPVAMKFKIYKPIVPDPTRQGINNALLPWVYDQDRSSGFDASMWVTPVATLPPQPQEAAPRKPLTDEQLIEIYLKTNGLEFYKSFARAIEAAHGIKERKNEPSKNQQTI